jgi:nitrogen regulatory protein P-II 1
MKLITAVVRPGKLDGLIETLIGHGAHGLTVTEVRGFGRQLGQIAPRPGERDRDGWGGSAQEALLPKVRLEILALDEDAETLAGTIAKHARTDTIGDGKIWIAPVDGVVRIRTGECDQAAI